MTLKVQKLPGGGGLYYKAKLLQFKQINFRIVQRIHLSAPQLLKKKYHC